MCKGEVGYAQKQNVCRYVGFNTGVFGFDFYF